MSGANFQALSGTGQNHSTYLSSTLNVSLPEIINDFFQTFSGCQKLRTRVRSYSKISSRT